MTMSRRGPVITRAPGALGVSAAGGRAQAVTALLDLLERSSSGRAFAEECLTAAMRTWGLTHAALVLYDDELGRLVITPDGSAPEPALAALVDERGEAGLVTLPDLPPDPIPWAVTHVASIALTLDRQGWAPTLDPATGLYTPTAFRRQAVLAGERFRHGEHPFAVVALDIDGVDGMTDRTLDDVVARVAGAVSSRLRRIDAAARVGRARFAVVLEGADREDARAFLTRVEHGLAADAVLRSVDFRVGIASCPEDDLDLDALVDTAALRLGDGEIRLHRIAAPARELVATFDPSWLRGHTTQHTLPATAATGPDDGPYLAPPRPARRVDVAPLPPRRRFGRAPA